jgi:DNA primase catalytic core
MIQNIDEIKGAVQIADIIGDFVHLKKKGVNWVANCPFHTEKSPSFIVNSVRNIFKCFGCGKNGDAIEFLKEHEAMTYMEAILFIAKKYSIKVEQDNNNDYSEAEKRKDGLFTVLKWAKDHFSANLLKNKAALDYLKKRKLSDAIEEFSIGYAESGNDLMRSASAAGYSNDILLAAGLIKQNSEGDHYYDAFNKRVIFPFYDRSGRVIGFTGRLLTQEKDKAKYLNTAETDLFKKSKILYGLFQSKIDMKKEDDCILVEGQTDVISMRLAGIGNVVAGSGTALSEDQVRMIKSLSSSITVIYDDDIAGIKASVSNIKIPLQLGLDVYIVVLPTGEDPDSFVGKIGGDAMGAYIETNRKDFVSFRVSLVKDEVSRDPLQKAKLVTELTNQICLVPDQQTREILLDEIAKQLDVKDEIIIKQVKKQLPDPEKQPPKGFYGLEVSAAAIKESDCAIILNDPKEVINRHAEGKENTISLPGSAILKDDIYKVATLTRNIIIEGLSKIVDESDIECPLAYTGRILSEHGLHVQVINDEIIEPADFFDHYIDELARHLHKNPDTKRSKRYIELVAGFLSKLDNTIIHIKTNGVAQKFGLTQASFTKVLKPYIDKRKSLATQEQERIVIDAEQYVFDIAHLPDYVDQNFFQRYGFFPAQNKTGHKIFYVFRTLDNTLSKVGNFYLEPLFHVHDLDPNKNKRIAMLYHAELNKEEYVEIKSSAMAELTQFKNFLFNVGGYLLTGAKPFHYEKILESNALRYPKCWEISTFGHQPEGFFAFTNGIIADGSFTSVDELGLVRYKNETYYSPSCSKIFKDQRSDNDKYAYDRFLIYRADQRTSWTQWSTLMKDVFKYNDNGMWALLFTLLASNRSIIFPIERFFTALFFIGPTDSGKSRIAESIRAPWMFNAPLFNLNSGTDAAFFTSLERFRDIPLIFEEYNDYQISDTKFQGLKAAVYDNEGKQKRKDASSKDIEVSKINGAPILLGQEGPERDDGALRNRVVELHVPKKEEWSDEEVNLYTDLKDREKDGLSNIALEIIKRRGIVQQYFAGYMRHYQKQLKQDIRIGGGTFQTRMINTVSLFVAMAKLWEDHVKELPLPFTFDEFYNIAKRQIIRQSEEMGSSNRLAVFFDTISMLYAQGQIISGREFDIETMQEVTIQTSNSQTKPVSFDGVKKKVLFLIVNDIILAYQKIHTNESLKMNALRMYLKDHPSYIGQVKGHRFTYQYEAWESDPATDSTRRVIHKADRNTSCIALDYEIIFKMGIDLERIKPPEQFKLPLNEINGKNVVPLEQTAMEFSENVLSKTDDDGLPF